MLWIACGCLLFFADRGVCHYGDKFGSLPLGNGALGQIQNDRVHNARAEAYSQTLVDCKSVRGFGWGAVHLHLAGIAGAFCGGALLEEAYGGEVLIEAHGYR